MPALHRMKQTSDRPGNKMNRNIEVLTASQNKLHIIHVHDTLNMHHITVNNGFKGNTEV